MGKTSKRAVGHRVLLAGVRCGGETQVERARLCGLPVQSLGDYERGARAIGSQALIAICKGYGVSADALLGLPKRIA